VRPHPAIATAAGLSLGFGLGAIALGSVLFPIGEESHRRNQCHDPTGEMQFDCEYGPGGRMVTTGIVSLALGGILVATSIPLFILANRRSGRASAVPTARVAPNGVDLQWSY
jgi:hypothetical protein